MSKIRSFTEEQKAELLCNPYTFRVCDCKMVFTLEFKRFVIDNIDKPGMTAAKVFDLAGYNRDLFSPKYRRNVVERIRKEAGSQGGLKDPTPIKSVSKKKHTETEFKELKNRVSLLEQELDFLKKSQVLKHKKIP